MREPTVSFCPPHSLELVSGVKQKQGSDSLPAVDLQYTQLGDASLCAQRRALPEYTVNYLLSEVLEGKVFPSCPVNLLPKLQPSRFLDSVSQNTMNK